jgi:hypothetical protein
MSTYFPFPPPSPPAGTTQNRNLAESTFTEMVNINIVLPAPHKILWTSNVWQTNIFLTKKVSCVLSVTNTVSSKNILAYYEICTLRTSIFLVQALGLVFISLLTVIIKVRGALSSERCCLFQSPYVVKVIFP